MNRIIHKVTENIIERSKESRVIYLERIQKAKKHGVNRKNLSFSNLAHTMAAMSPQDKRTISDMQAPNIAIVSAYNDMLSAHEPLKAYPDIIKKALNELGATAQVAGGVPAMCDGITQSQPGMELSLFSRDIIAQATAIALTHNAFDGAIYLGVCDKIVPGLFIGAMSFGHLPATFMPAGPMTSGISNSEKAKIRQEYALGKITPKELLQAESASYHDCGTCTFYGTANSNQMLMEIFGLQLPNSSFVNANTPLREELTKYGAKNILNMTQLCETYKPIADIVDERSFVNAIIGLMATGGSTNHTIHLIAMARACGIILNWSDFDEISKVTPLLCKMYPNGSSDVNAFRDAGGMATVIHQLLIADLLHEDVETIMGRGLSHYIVEPCLEEEKLIFKSGAKISRDKNVISSLDTPFSPEGGLKLIRSTLGRSIIKTSAIKKDHQLIIADAIVFESQEELQSAFKAGELEKDFIAIVKYQGPRANGMPELHGLMPPLGVLQDKGYKVAVITDGRMSGASGKVPAALHMTPEALCGGALDKIKTGDKIRFDIQNGEISVLIDEEEFNNRIKKTPNLDKNHHGFGRELFAHTRQNVNQAEDGGGIFNLVGKERG